MNAATGEGRYGNRPFGPVPAVGLQDWLDLHVAAGDLTLGQARALLPGYPTLRTDCRDCTPEELAAERAAHRRDEAADDDVDEDGA